MTDDVLLINCPPDQFEEEEEIIGGYGGLERESERENRRAQTGLREVVGKSPSMTH
jgi:hypothetical protein